MEHNSILDAVQEYQDILKVLHLSNVRSNRVPCSIIAAALKLVELYTLVKTHARAVVIDHLEHGRKIYAIKDYKNLVGVSLKEAKDVVDEMAPIFLKDIDEEARIDEEVGAAHSPLGDITL